MIYLTGIYFFVLSALNLADISSTCNSRRFNLSVNFLIGLLLSHSANTALENFLSSVFPQEFPRPTKKNNKSGSKLATVTNQPLARPPSTSSDQKKFLHNHLKVLTVTDLVENFKSGTLSRKMSISERLGTAMHLRNGHEQKREKIKTFQNKTNAKIFIFS